MICPNCGATLGLHATSLDLIAPPPVVTPPPPPPPTPVVTSYDDTLFIYRGTWNTGPNVDSTLPGKYLGSDHYSNVTGSSFEVDFVGTQIALVSALAPQHGIASAQIDGGPAMDIDFYAAARADQALAWTSPVLAAGPHTLVVTVTGRKNPASSGYYISADKVAITGTLSAPPAPPPPPPAAAFSIAVAGNKLVDGAGKTIQLRGANRMGMEYSCIQGTGLADGPLTQATIDAMKTWKINCVRIPLNEDCWLAINGVASQYGGSNYQQALKNWVNLITASGLYVILDLHWTKPGTAPATGQDLMASNDHSPVFWSQVASMFKDNPAVLFDLFNEPHAISWATWRNGDGTYAGMQKLLDAVRATGATNVCMAGGLAWANDLTGWLANKPNDPLGQLAASWHCYSFNAVSAPAAFDANIAPVAAQVPVVAGEIGSDSCNATFFNNLMNWCDAHGVSYLAWTWTPNSSDSCSAIKLIRDYTGTPATYGQPFRDHLVAMP